jgi:hypothetical protein
MTHLAGIVDAASPLPISRECIERLHLFAAAALREKRQLRVGSVDHDVGCS